MVLHGVQHVAIVDDAVVTDDDLFTNFCAGLDSKGKYRAEVAAALLTELNPDCTITAVTSPPDSLAGIADLPARSVVVTTGNRPPGFLRGISEIAAAKRTSKRAAFSGRSISTAVSIISSKASRRGRSTPAANCGSLTRFRRSQRSGIRSTSTRSTTLRIRISRFPFCSTARTENRGRSSASTVW